MLENTSKSNGRGAQLKALNSIIKNVPKYRLYALGGAVTTSSGARAVCDEYRCVRIYNNSVIMPEKKIEHDLMDLDRLFTNVKSGGAEVDLPKAREIEQRFKLARAEFTGKRTDFKAFWALSDGDKIEYFNAKFLIDMLNALPGAVAMFGDGHRLYFKAPDGDGLLLGVKLYGDTSTAILNNISVNVGM